MDLIRKNLMSIPNYSPYCGSEKCSIIPRTVFDGEQFKCPCCGWRSEFPMSFILEYKNKWSK